MPYPLPPASSRQDDMHALYRDHSQWLQGWIRRRRKFTVGGNAYWQSSTFFKPSDEDWYAIDDPGFKYSPTMS